eukprot:g4119.t1
MVSRQEECNISKKEAPVYYPSEKEFERPLEFIESIRNEAEVFGICRIIPPPSWKPSFSLNLTQFQFPTRVQSIHQLYKRDAAEQSKDDWWEKYIAFQLAQNKKQRTRNPILGGKELDLCRLYSAVEKRGGYHEVCTNKLWKDIARYLQVTVHLSNGNTTYSLRNVYEKYLKDFEEKETGSLLMIQDEQPEFLLGESEETWNPTSKKIKQEGKLVNEDVLSTPVKVRRRRDGKVPGNLEVLMCEHCGGGQFEDCIILCDNCPTHRTKGYHTFCCSPPYDRIPDGNFYCPDCSAKLFARQCFTPGPDTTYEEFKDYATEFENSYRSANIDIDKKTTSEALENEFWRIVESGEEAVDVLYGADLPTGTFGSGFPTDGHDAYSSHPMNLNNLPRDKSSLLRLIPEDIPGVLVPWLYIGMKFSAFCWHVEDHLFYSINYLHKGAIKKWYGVSSKQALQFEDLLRNKLLKDQFSEQPDLLFHITTMVSPDKLRENGIEICETLQSLNVAEAVNFAPVHWLEFRKRAEMRYIHHRKPQVLSTEELVLRAALEPDRRFHGESLYQELTRIVQEETLNRLAVWNEGIMKSMKLNSCHGLKAGETEDVSCVICRDYLHISAVVCSTCHRPCCLRHVHQQCECLFSSRTLLYRFTLAELADIRDKIKINNNNNNDSNFTKTTDFEETGVKRDRDSIKSRENFGWSRFRSFQEDWRRRAEAVLVSTDLDMPSMEQLVFESMQFLWAGHEVDDLRQLCVRIEESLEWYSGFTRSMNNENQKLTIDELQKLISKHPAKSSHPALLKLKKIKKNVKDWIVRAEDMLHPSQEIEFRELLEFYRQGAEMNVQLPCLESVKMKLHEVQALQRTIESIFRDPSSDFPAPLMNFEELQLLLEKANNLKIEFKERNQLEDLMSRIEDWIERVRQTEGQRSTYSCLSELLNELSPISADIPELLRLKSRIQSAEEWIQEAKDALTSCQSVHEMRSLLLRAKELELELDDESIYETRLAQLEWKDWVHQSMTLPVTLDQLDEFLKRAVACDGEDMELFKAVKCKKQRAVDLQNSAQDVMEKIKEWKPGCEKLEFGVLRSLVQEYQDLRVTLSLLQECEELYQSSHPINESISHSMESMDSDGVALKSWELSPVVTKAEILPIAFPCFTELKQRISLAEDFASKCSKLLTTGLNVHHLPELKDFLKLGDEFIKTHGFRIAEVEILLEWDTRLRLEWLMHHLLCDSDECYASVIGWPLDTVEFSPLMPLKTLFDDQVDSGTSNGHKKASLDAVCAVLEQAKLVNANYQLLSRLERAYFGAKKWTEYTRETLQGQRKLKIVEAMNLLQLGKDNAFQLEGIEELDDIVIKHTSWTKNANRVLSQLDSRKVPLDEVQRFLTEVNQYPIDAESELMNKLKVVVHPGLELKDSFEKLFRHHSLTELISTIDAVLSVTPVSHECQNNGLNGCYCGNINSAGVQLDTIHCAKCSHWYHMRCIPYLVKSSRRWLCPGCKEEANKPSIGVLQSHLNRCQMLKVSLSEEKKLKLVISRYHEWLSSIRRQLEAHERSHLIGGEPNDALTDYELSLLWKQALIVGVDSREVANRALSAMKVEKYRPIIRRHLQEGGPTRFDIERCRKEEIPLYIVAKKPQVEVVRSFVENSAKFDGDNPTTIVAEDPLMTLAKRALVSVQNWEAECQKLSCLLSAHAGRPIEQVPCELLHKTHEHIDKATTMKIQVDRTALEQLIFQSTAYCVCRQTNDMDRPMLACEEEDDCPILWFHHRCVGLSETEAPPPGFKCPQCCFRKGQIYPYKLPRGSEMEFARQYGVQDSNPVFPVQMTAAESETSVLDEMTTTMTTRKTYSTTAGLDISKLFSEVASDWANWSDIERLRVLEHVSDCVREESRRIHEMQQKAKR